MKRTRWWKPYTPLLCGGICLLAALGAGIGIAARKNAGNLRLQTIAGDPAELAPYRIEAQLLDMKHAQDILVEGGQLSHQFRRLPIFEGSLTETHMMRNQVYLAHPEGVHLPLEEDALALPPGAEQDVKRKAFATDTLQVAIELEEWSTRNRWANRSSSTALCCAILTDVVIKHEQPVFQFSYTSPTQYPDPYSFEGWSVADSALESLYTQSAPHVVRTEAGETYVFTRANPYCSGEAALYRVDEWASMGVAPLQYWPGSEAYYAQAWPQGRAAKLAALPLTGQGIQTLHLAEVGDQLALLYIRQNMLTLRVYGKDGALRLEQALFAYAPPGYTLECKLDILPAEEGDTLCYELYGIGPNLPDDMHKMGESRHFAVLLRRDGAQLLSSCTSRQDQVTKRAVYLDGRWIMVLENVDIYGAGLASAYGQYPADVPHAHMATLQVLDAAGEVLYLGGLHTDAAQDRLQFQRLSENAVNTIYNYPTSFMRSYSSVRTLAVPEDGITRR